MTRGWPALHINSLLIPVSIIMSVYLGALALLHFHLLTVAADFATAVRLLLGAGLGLVLGAWAGGLVRKSPPVLFLGITLTGAFFGIAASYWNIIALHTASNTPWFLAVPYFFGAAAVSAGFSERRHAGLAVGAALFAAAGLITSSLLLPLLKAETVLFLLPLLPVLPFGFLGLLSQHWPLRLGFAAGAVFFLFLAAFPLFDAFVTPEIHTQSETEALIDDAGTPGGPQSISPAAEFLQRVYLWDERSQTYQFQGTNEDWKRAELLFDVLGYRNRFGLPFHPLWETRPVPWNMGSVSKDAFEKYILQDAADKYAYSAPRNEDSLFLGRVLSPSDQYHFTGAPYELDRYRFLLASLGRHRVLDLAMDIRRHGALRLGSKFFAGSHRLFFSRDSLAGRIDFVGDEGFLFTSVNGVIRDTLDPSDGFDWDPRVPRVSFLPSPRIFIGGLSADGIVKSARRVPDARLAGSEENPVLLETIGGDTPFARFSGRPYRGVEILRGTPRQALQQDARLWDIITLVNAHPEHGPVSTFQPEHNHTVEALDLYMGRLSPNGLVAISENLFDRGQEVVFLRLLNTVRQTLASNGADHPENHLYLFQWDLSPQGRSFRTLLVKKTPFTSSQLSAMEEYLRSLNATGLYANVETLFTPRLPLLTEEDKWLRAPMSVRLRELPRNLAGIELSQRVLPKINDPEDLQFLLTVYTHTRFGRFTADPERYAFSERLQLERIFEEASFPLEYDTSPVKDDRPFPFSTDASLRWTWHIAGAAAPLLLLLALGFVFHLRAGVGMGEPWTGWFRQAVYALGLGLLLPGLADRISMSLTGASILGPYLIAAAGLGFFAGTALGEWFMARLKTPSFLWPAASVLAILLGGLILVTFSGSGASGWAVPLFSFLGLLLGTSAGLVWAGVGNAPSEGHGPFRLGLVLGCLTAGTAMGLAMSLEAGFTVVMLLGTATALGMPVWKLLRPEP